jgi:hypothetical protein
VSLDWSQINTGLGAGASAAALVTLAWAIGKGLRELWRVTFGRPPIYLPISVAPGEWGTTDSPDALCGK